MFSVMQRNGLEYPWQPPKKAAEKKRDKFIRNLMSVERNGQELDYAKLEKAICDDDSYYEQEALEKVGVRVGKTPSEAARIMREIMTRS